jgi:hypothetical protein
MTIPSELQNGVPAIKVFLIYMGTGTGIHGVAFLGFVENFSCLVKLFISGPSAK